MTTNNKDEPMAQVISLIRESKRIVAFSGAGISTEAGIPDFRSKGGLWEDPGLMELMSARGFDRDPAGFYQASIQLMPNIHKAKPTAAHALLARLEAQDKLTAVITQNIDGLHQSAGSQRVYEIHGTFRTGRCINCRVVYHMMEFYNQIERGELNLPRCSKCRSPIKPDVVLFGDLLPFDVWNSAVEKVKRCDLMLVLGSSLLVYPAAELPNIALASGAKLIIVNREATEYDALADVVVHSQLGDFASAIIASL
ncbi:MAG: NAD-dependent deacylase [Acidobacteria bacterium]|nr:NAD-dependent deacylase [Acidobacteriota bacterium]